jgi:threonyl-tRNA synthetase
MSQEAKGIELKRHSYAHIMAEAVLKSFPDAKIAIGPAIENGFYYDFDLPRSLTQEDLERISADMKAIIKEGRRFERRVLSKAEAAKLFQDQPFKLELLAELPEAEEISTYTQGAFTDLCRGPHVESTKELDPEAFKLMSVAGAYWRGDEKRPMLQRIYGVAFDDAAGLKAHLDFLAEVEKRDHRKIGHELELFSVHEEAGPGLVYWHPNGGLMRVLIEQWWRGRHYEGGYDIVYSPHIGKSWLWETSGHLSFYKEGMYSPMEVDKADYYIKPMNCPFHIMMYKDRLRSYRELPLRWAELGTVYRYERSGALYGLFRVRGFTQDDAHIICAPEQVESEILEVLRFSLSIWKTLGFKEIKAYLATRPAGDGAVGEPEMWDKALASLKKAIDAEGLAYEIDEGGGAFYGPKIDLKLKDAIGREWQVTTIQFDFNLPERFDMKFVDSDGKEKRPYMVHRALLGSIERFFGILIEHYAGAFPLWLCPVQACVIPVAPGFGEFAKELAAKLKARGLRAEADLSEERMNAKIRAAQGRKIPYMLIVGQKEKDEGTVSLRYRDGRQANGMPLEEFVGMALAKIESKDTEI